VIGQLNRAKAFAAQGPMIDGTIRVSCDLDGLSLFDIDQNPATPMTHPAMTFYDRIVAIDFHLTGCIRERKLSHNPSSFFVAADLSKLPLLLQT
jgi:hypothetical protein